MLIFPQTYGAVAQMHNFLNPSFFLSILLVYSWFILSETSAFRWRFALTSIPSLASLSKGGKTLMQ